MTKVFEQYGYHSRMISVHLDKDICLECGQDKTVIIFDSSDGEYSPMSFCLACIEKFFNPDPKNTQHN